MRCWCGNDRLTPFSDGYQRCDACQTLVSVAMAETLDTRVRDDAADFYGRDYWFNHQTQSLGCPDIVSRSRTDFSDRCPHWLRTLMRFVLPPARVLEVGCGHGGFVAMMRQAGYDAMGLELSPSIVKFARDTFGAPVVRGTIEEQSIAPGSLDAIVMLDVMEHLPQPKQTLRRCLECLKPGGVMFIQTPGYPEHKSLLELNSTGHKFPMMLDPQEHLFLFSQSSAATLFRELGARHIQFVPAVFGFYDMSFVVSRETLTETTLAQQAATLSASLSGRFLQAILDLDDRRLSLLQKYRDLSASSARRAG